MWDLGFGEWLLSGSFCFLLELTSDHVATLAYSGILKIK